MTKKECVNGDSVKTNYSYRRLVIQHDSTIGYRFISDIYSRIRRPNNTFVIQTNKQGFRDNYSFDNLGNGLNILALGDSYVAGDGILNHERFMNILAKRLNVNVLNMGLPGSGSDQQLLIQEKIATRWKYDVLVIVPFLHHIHRNLKSQMDIWDWATKRRIDIQKPYYELLNGELKLENFPVPIAEKFFIDGETDISENGGLRKVLRDGLPELYTTARRLKSEFANMAYRVNWKKADSEYADPSSYPWRLMRAIFERMIRNAGEREVVIIPIPLPQHIRSNAYPHYLDRFHELVGDNVNLVDILPVFGSMPDKEQLFIPEDGHYTAYGNEIIADVCEPLFQRILKIRSKKRASRNPAAKKSNGDSKYILGVSCFYHDSAAAVIKNGEIVAAAQEERFTRVKHDKSFPVNAITYCLEQSKIERADLDAVVYYDNEHLTLERMLATQLYIGPGKSNVLKKALAQSIPTKFSIWRHLRNELGSECSLFRAVHHRSHAASAFYPSPFKDAAIVTVDGVGEWSTTTIGIGEDNKIKILKEQRFPHSLGLLYSAFTSFCGFKVNSGEYKLMGLAPYGKPKYQEKIEQNLMDIQDDGSYKLNLRYFAFLEGERMTNLDFAALFGGPPRRSETKITQRECDIARSIQAVIEKIMLLICNEAYQISRKDNLVLAGGVALNCVANGKILKQGPFKNIWIQPAAGDAGGAIGAALDLWYGTWENPRIVGKTDQRDSCFGPAFSDAEVKSFLDFHTYKYNELTTNERAAVIANYLSEGRIVGHFSGRMEFGPRALGSRSILADPRNIEMQRILNLKIKYRESFRPFAPVVLEERICDYFEIDCASPYMLLVAKVNKEIKIDIPEQEDREILTRLKQTRSEIPAVTHVDYSARIQSVSKDRSPVLYDILKKFELRTGCGVLVNTSFNVRGEPIVCTPEDAYRCFMRTEMDILVLNNFILKKEEQPQWLEESSWETEYALD